MSHEPPYVPTAEQIAADCRNIRAGWTATQEHRRLVTKPQPLECQVVPITDLLKTPTPLF